MVRDARRRAPHHEVPYDAIFGRGIGWPSACSTRSKVSISTRMLDSRPALNCAKCASRRLIGLLESMRGQRIAHHRRRRIHAQHDGFPVEAVDADVVGDLPADLQHGGLAAAAAQKRKHVDRPVDRPFDVVVDQRLEVLLLALVDRARAMRAKNARDCALSWRSPETGFAGQHAALRASSSTPCLQCCIPN